MPGSSLNRREAAAVVGACPGAAWDVRRSGLEVVIELEAAAFSDAAADAIRRAVRRDNPDVDQMISSGLVGDIRVEPREFADVAIKRGTVARPAGFEPAT